MLALPYIDGLQQFDAWYATLSADQVDKLLADIDPLFDSVEREFDRTLKLSTATC